MDTPLTGKYEVSSLGSSHGIIAHNENPTTLTHADGVHSSMKLQLKSIIYDDDVHSNIQYNIGPFFDVKDGVDDSVTVTSQDHKCGFDNLDVCFFWDGIITWQEYHSF